MCDRSNHIACTLKSLIEEIPPNEDTLVLQSLYRKVFYMAPEICDQAWVSVFNILRSNYDTGEEYQHKMCDLYNNGYREYLEKFVN
jgi:hypothetical protein